MPPQDLEQDVNVHVVGEGTCASEVGRRPGKQGTGPKRLSELWPGAALSSDPDGRQLLLVP